MKDKLERLLKSVAYLKGKQVISYQKDIAVAMDMHKSTISLALKGDEKYLTDSFLKRFGEVFGLDISWLLTGKGEMTTDRKGEEKSNTYPEKETIQVELSDSLLSDRTDMASLVTFLSRNHERLMKDELYSLYIHRAANLLEVEKIEEEKKRKIQEIREDAKLTGNKDKVDR